MNRPIMMVVNIPPPESPAAPIHKQIEKESWWDKALSDAKDAIDYFEDEIATMLVDDEEASSDIYDYPNGDEYHHERHTDRGYSLLDAAELITELDEFEETDTGLWQDCDLETSISTKAAFTYGSAVMGAFDEIIKKINSRWADELNEIDADEDFDWAGHAQKIMGIICESY